MHCRRCKQRCRRKHAVKAAELCNNSIVHSRLHLFNHDIPARIHRTYNAAVTVACTSKCKTLLKRKERSFCKLRIIFLKTDERALKHFSGTGHAVPHRSVLCECCLNTGKCLTRLLVVSGSNSLHERGISCVARILKRSEL